MLTIVFFAVFAATSSAKIVTYNFDIGWVNIAPDGFSRPVIAINGKWPIPIIEVDVGDTVIITATNSLRNQTTSLHFHGQYQGGTASADGTAGITQCPIYPGESYIYNFTAWPAGTHWYHSHVKGQYADGLRGLMIIHDHDWENSLDVDEQVYLTISDWWHEEQPPIIDRYMSPDNRDGDIESPDTLLLNDSRNAPDLHFDPGTRYLLRLANIGGLACSNFHIEGYNMTVVAIDGSTVCPYEIGTIRPCAGQRYDVIVTGQEHGAKDLRYIAKMSADITVSDLPPLNLRSVIGNVIRKGNRDHSSKEGTVALSETLTPDWTPVKVLNEFDLSDLDEVPLFEPVNHNIYLISNMSYFEGIGTRTALGILPWVNPRVPTLYTALTSGPKAEYASTYGAGVDPWVLESDSVVQIYMENPDPWPHPMHLHGHRFQLVRLGSGIWDGDESDLPATPASRDTVVVPPYGYVVLRFRADNPGVWLFHCHIDLHMIGGMSSTFIEAPKELQAQQAINRDSVDACNRAKIPTLGNCAAKLEHISWEQSLESCYTVFNFKPRSFSAMFFEGQE
ncbi:multicopper oxidase [Aaosphaeria arxii CBS 175.79]|uniref:Multicopper oxidase n=1 Tax=Aaosphaeria arxii CBS 175.79 TaxID=1450172 RepID=A0A6A5X8U7_9PLEO|nr:multicopper oxidase [Aaosphaeria arxii CBS 175.79]KAF2009388.1 multicopper oxidase [Aaosphaeria arxii CBS 175.79]